MLLKPDIKLNRITDINVEILKKFNIKALLLDVDNTMSTHHGTVLVDGLKDWILNMQQNGTPKACRFRLSIKSSESRAYRLSEKRSFSTVSKKCLPPDTGRVYRTAGCKRGSHVRRNEIVRKDE